MSVDGLRTSDVTSLFVLTQDLVRQPLGRLSADTLTDLFALSELEDQLPKTLLRDLESFSRQMTREIGDLPLGSPLDEFLREMAAIPGRRVPATLRPVVLALDVRDGLSAEAAELIREMAGRWKDAPPERITLPKKQLKTIQRTEAPLRLQTPDRQEEMRKAAGTERVRSPRAPAAQRDERRPAWIRECLMDRLDEYGERGLKEAVLLAGLRHRSPFDDLTDAEVLAELRALKRDARVRFAAGRWIRVQKFVR